MKDLALKSSKGVSSVAELKNQCSALVIHKEE